MASTTSTPQKNQSSYFDNPYGASNTPVKVLDNVDVTPSRELRDRNYKSDIFNREQVAVPESKVDHIRSNDTENDSAAATFRARQQKSSIFDEEEENLPYKSQKGQVPASDKPYKISNVF